MGRAVLIMVTGSIVVFMIASTTIITSLARATEYSVGLFSDIQARNIANSTAEMVLAIIADSNDYRPSSTVTLSDLLGGSATYTTKDTVISGQTYVSISATGHYFNT